MNLLTPDLGLLFWMLVSFGIVFFVLAKYGFPIIVKMVDERKAFIDSSLASAKEANEQLAGIREESEKILSTARTEQLRILNEAGKIRDKMVEDAKNQAKIEADKLLEKATDDIRKAKDGAMSEIRAELAALSVGIAEKVLRGQLENAERQSTVINRLLDEINIHQS
jgi:F-type H+-transporting ATPase subunit b